MNIKLRYFKLRQQLNDYVKTQCGTDRSLDTEQHVIIGSQDELKRFMLSPTKTVYGISVQANKSKKKLKVINR